MQFITTDQRIAVENFQIGLIYTVTFIGGRSFSGACIGKGADFVMFQRTAPELVYCLNMAAAEDVESIEQTGGGGGTLNYNDLYNKPQINNVELTGNKSLDNLGIQAKLTFDSAPTEDSENPVQSGGVYSALDQKQNALSSTQLSAVNSGITSDDVAQITTNKNNISSVQEQANWNTNNGVKNICPYNSGSTSGDGTVWNNLPIDIAAGTYSLSFSTDSTNSALVLLAADGLTEIFRKTYSTTTVNDTFTISTAVKYIRLYIGVSKTVSNFMIHSFGDDTFVPYAPSNAELYAMIQALQTQLSNQ